ncbi:hypothetical protein CHS0354_036522, partial [Potamilus streckersoni]
EYEYLLESVGKLTEFRKARKVTTGKMMSAFILDSLEPKDKKQGTGGAIYKKELALFQDLMSRTFYDLMIVSIPGDIQYAIDVQYTTDIQYR